MVSPTLAQRGIQRDGVPPPTPTGWFCVVPGRVPASGEHGGGSFAACGRDAGLKTGVPTPALLARPSQGDKVRVV